MVLEVVDPGDVVGRMNLSGQEEEVVEAERRERALSGAGLKAS